MRSEVTFEVRGDVLYPGFKPFVWHLASEAGLSGWISDSPDGVMLNFEGEESEIEDFMLSFPERAEPSFRLTSVRVIRSSPGDPEPPQRPRFRVLASLDRAFPEIRPDYAPCPDCLAEMNDPLSRRFCYPFFSCSKCGSVYSAMKRSPFKRVNTFFSAFPPCRKCAFEKGDYNDAHHYASEFLSCPDCGPRLILLDPDGNALDEDRNVCLARRIISEGGIIALQSMFGAFRLYADAFNAESIRTLRERRKIPVRPIAVVARDIETVKKYFICSDSEADLLLSPAAPITILRIRRDAPPNPAWSALCSDGAYIGVSLPQTMPIHLLFSHRGGSPEGCVPPFELLASVSGRRENVSHDAETQLVYESLRNCADAFLCHDLRIGVDCIPSIAVVRGAGVQIWRRSRGYVPLPVILPSKGRRFAAAFGTDTDASVSLAFSDRIVQSHSLGENLTLESADRCANALTHLCELFDAVPDAVVCDMNQNLMTSAAAADFADRHGLPLVMVQTHHAHALSCMAEHGLERATGIVFGEGVRGPDGTFWGAELMDARIGNFLRLGSFAPASVPGRDSALQRPARQLAGRLCDAGVELTAAHLELLHASVDEASIWADNCAGIGRVSKTHAAFRLMDAIAAGLGFAPDFIGYRNQSSVRLEYAALDIPGGIDSVPERIRKAFEFDAVEADGFFTVDWTKTFRNLFSSPGFVDRNEASLYALAFHDALADSVVAMAEYAESRTGMLDVALSGGCFMNGILSSFAEEKLIMRGFKVHLHRAVPPNEEGISVGQAYHGSFAS